MDKILDAVGFLVAAAMVLGPMAVMPDYDASQEPGAAAAGGAVSGGLGSAGSTGAASSGVSGTTAATAVRPEASPAPAIQPAVLAPRRTDGGVPSDMTVPGDVAPPSAPAVEAATP
jgi:hypothetical protein